MAVLIDLNPFFPKPVVIQVGDVEHRLDAAHLTTELVLEIDQAQRAMQAVQDVQADGGEELLAAADEANEAWTLVVDRIAAMLEAHCTPRLVVRQLPPAALGSLVGSLYQAAMGGLPDDGGDDPPAAAPRRGRTTSSSKPGPPRRRAAGN